MENKKTLILAGGGHTHALLLKKIQQAPLPPDVRLILLSTTRHTPYSGMLPGVISGHYTPEQAHIDLQQLARNSQCEFLESSVNQLDPDSRIITTDQGAQLKYDLLSINTGSTQTQLVDAQHCLCIKPVHHFLKWLYHDLPERLSTHTKASHIKAFELVIIGAGAAGVETAMALKKRYYSHNVDIHIVSGSQVLPGYPKAIQTMVHHELERKNIFLHQNFRVTSVENQQLISNDGASLAYDQLILATSASPASWPSESQLTTDARGFILVNNSLQSVSHPTVFAAGDIATLSNSGVAKCGVYAVRQTPVLYSNLLNMLSAKSLIPFQPQQQFLALLSCADGRAIASRGWFRAKGKMVWHWKDTIDRRFMNQFPTPAPGSFN